MPRRNNNQPSESNRYDGAPAPDPSDVDAGRPSRSEVKKAHRDHLRDTGCQAPDCDVTDPDVLGRYPILAPSCTAMQHPHDPYRVLCDTHYEERPESYLDKRLSQFETREDRDMAVVYDCGRVPFLRFEAKGDPRTAPVVTIEQCCRCGEGIDRIVRDE